MERTQSHSVSWKFVTYLKDYCANCTLAGFAYIANQNLHTMERFFWVLCILASSFGCYHLIQQYQKDFTTRAVSIVYENVQPFSKFKFPSVTVCERSYKQGISEAADKYVMGLGKGFEDDPINYEVQTFVAMLLYPSTVLRGSIDGNCSPYEDCEECAKCPKKSYRKLLNMIATNCSDIFVECKLSNRKFDCCKYFLPMYTPTGRCFMLNSLHNNKPGSKHWLNAVLDPSKDEATLTLTCTGYMEVFLLNEEDVVIATDVGMIIPMTNQHKTYYFSTDPMINDHDVREVSAEARSCYFPDELQPSSVYKAYSFSTCVNDCSRELQLEFCNCTYFSMVPHRNKHLMECEYEGLICLSKHGLMRMDLKKLFSLIRHKKHCKCLPSCTEADIHIYYESNPTSNTPQNTRSITLTMPQWPTDLYRRQALRTRLDAIVSMGGILGLFLGASILSVIEFIYFFTLRAANLRLQARHSHAP